MVATFLLIQSTALSVASFGAVGNGVSNDTHAIQAAADAALRANAALFFPPGTYVVNGALAIGSNATWSATPGTATLVATQGNPLITAVETHDSTVSGLTLEGSTSNSKTPSALLIAYKSLRFTLANAAIENTSGIGVLFSDVNSTTVSGTTFTNVGKNSNLKRSAQGVAFTNDASGYGSANTVKNCLFKEIGLDAMSATGQTNFSAISNVVANSSIDPGWATQNAAAAGFYGYQDTGLTVADNSIGAVSGNGIDINASHNVDIYQNRIMGTGSAGIALYSSTHGTITWNVSIDNNALRHFQSQGGIVVGAANASQIVVAHNLSGNGEPAATQPYGIQVLDGQSLASAGLVISKDNVLPGNSLAPISDAGSYSSVTNDALPTATYAVDVNDPPVIGGVPAMATVTGGAITPFSSASISDMDMGVAETVTVTVGANGAVGTLSGPGVVATAERGTYAVGAAAIAPAAATAALRAVTFVPAAGSAGRLALSGGSLVVNVVQSSPTSHSTVTSTATTKLQSAGP